MIPTQPGHRFITNAPPLLAVVTTLALALGCDGAPPAPVTNAVPRGDPAVLEGASWPSEIAVEVSGGPAVVTEVLGEVEENYVALLSTFNIEGATSSERIVPIETASARLSFGDGVLTIREARIDLPDLIVGAVDFPPDGVLVRDVWIEAADVAGVHFVETAADVRYAELELDVIVHWGLDVGEEEPYPLADVAIDGIPVMLTVERDAATRTVTLGLDAATVEEAVETGLITIHEVRVSMRANGGY